MYWRLSVDAIGSPLSLVLDVSQYILTQYSAIETCVLIRRRDHARSTHNGAIRRGKLTDAGAGAGEIHVCRQNAEPTAQHAYAAVGMARGQDQFNRATQNLYHSACALGKGAGNAGARLGHGRASKRTRTLVQVFGAACEGAINFRRVSCCPQPASS